MSTHRRHWFESAYTDYLKPLRGYLRRFASPEDAEELAHEAFLRVYTAPNFNTIRSRRSYLFRTARNLALNAASKHCTMLTEAVEDIAAFEDKSASVERRCMAEEEFAFLRVAIARFTPRRQKVFLLRFLYERSTQQIADELGVSTRTVHRHLARALEAIHVARSRIADRHSLLVKRVAIRGAQAQR